jgi:hypothetical protein
MPVGQPDQANRFVAPGLSHCGSFAANDDVFAAAVATIKSCLPLAQLFG